MSLEQAIKDAEAAIDRYNAASDRIIALCQKRDRIQANKVERIYIEPYDSNPPTLILPPGWDGSIIP